MADLLNYTGNANLGAGSNPDIPVFPSTDNLATINATARDLMLLDNQRNILLFNQKVKDRDKLTDMVLSDQVATGDILPQYQRYFDDAKKNVEKEFQEWRGDFNNTAGFLRYKNAVTKLKDVAAHAQVNTSQVRQLESEMAKEMLPRRKAEYQQWISSQVEQPFWNPIVPYQQLHDFNIDDVLSGVQLFKTEMADPKNPLFKYEVSYVDYNDILLKKRNQYINDIDAAHSIDQFVDKFQRYDNGQQLKTIESIDSQINKYNFQRGFTPADPRYVKPIQKEIVDGRVVIKEPKTEFAAKYTLANQEQFITRVPKFQKDIADYDIKLRKLEIDAKKLGLEKGAKNAYANYMNARAKQLGEQLKSDATNILKMYEDFVNNIKPQSLYRFGKDAGFMDAIYLDELPANYQFINGPVVDTKSGKVKIEKLLPFESKKGRKFYEPKYVDPSSGEAIKMDSELLKDGFNEAKKQGLVSNFNDYIRILLKKGKLEIVLKGKNGTANYTSMYQSAKALNAIGTTKGEENIINPPSTTPEEQEVPEQSQP